MAGLLNSTIGGTKPKTVLGKDMFEVDPVVMDPTKRAIDPTKETVSGQLSTLLSNDSPLMTAARTRADQASNARGLLNSSIAVGAGEKAAIETALPIATADANVYGTAARDNQAAENTAAQVNVGEVNQAAKFNAAELNQAPKMALGADLEKDLINLRTTNQQLLDSTKAAAGLFADTQRQISAIIADGTSSAETKAANVAQLTNMLKASLSMLGGMSNIDITDLLDFSAL